MAAPPLRYSLRVLCLVLLAALLPTGGVPGQAAISVAAPVGLTAIAFDSQVELAWQPVPGAVGYTVYRGSSETSITTPLTGVVGLNGTAFTDTTAPNGSTFFYAVTAADSTGASSAASNTASAAPRVRGCSSGNAVALENCYPGTTSWKLTGPAQPPSGIEGFATQTSINAGQSVDLKVNTASGAPYRIEIYRTGWYGGSEARLVSVLNGLHGTAQPFCKKDFTNNTGLIDCSNWLVGSTITTTPDWPSGVYLLRLVREDNGNDNNILLVVRHDNSGSALVYGVPVTTYEAYNDYGGRSLYTWNSSGVVTVSGTARAVMVSFDRPYNQSLDGQRNWYTAADVQNVAWLEQQGYDTTYVTSLDLHQAGSQLTSHRAFVSPAHDEYWSAEMRSAASSALASGVSLLYLGSNADYWKIRFTASPNSGVAGRVEVGYKTIESGSPDPSGIPTTTWRDPVVNEPENALLGEMYVGDNNNVFFPLKVSAAQGHDRAWRYTPLARMAPGTAASIGQYLVGWEWDSRAGNGFEPAAVATVAGTPVTGELIQGNGASSTAGNLSATAMATRYTAASGATVFDTGSQNWSRGLALNMKGVGEPSLLVQQATVNVLEDMGVRPTTPASGIVLDPLGALSLTGTVPAPGATGVPVGSTATATFDRVVDGNTVTNLTFTLTDPSGAAVPASVSYNSNTSTATLTPSSALAGGTAYTATISTAVHALDGSSLLAPDGWTFTTAAPDKQPPSTPTGLAVSGSTPTTLRLSWAPSTDDVGVAGYGLFLGGAADGATAATSATFVGLTCGSSYILGVDAFDAAGNTSPTATLTAQTAACPETISPSVSLIAPANGTTVSGTVSVSASAADNVGVVGVQFSLDGVNLAAEDTTAPYAISWDTTGAANGTHVVTAVARDAAGNSTVSNPVSVTVSNALAHPTPLPAATVAGVTVGPGFVDSSDRQLVRTAAGIVYIIASDDDPCQIGSGGVIRVWKGSGAQPGSSAAPASFTEMDGAHHPVSGGSNICQYTGGSNSALFSPDSRLDSSGTIHMVYIDMFTRNLYYQTFSTISDTWGPRTVIANFASRDSGFSWPRGGQAALTLDAGDVPHVVYVTAGISNQVNYTDRVSGFWSMPVTIFSGTNEMRPSLTTALDGTIHLTWLDNAEATNPVVKYARSVSGIWSSVETVSAGDTTVLSDSNGDSGPSVATDGIGRPFVGYLDGTVNGSNDYMRMRYRASSGVWTDDSPAGTAGGASSPSGTLFAHSPSLYVTQANDAFVFLGHDSLISPGGYSFQLGGPAASWSPYATIDPRNKVNTTAGYAGIDGSASTRFDPLRDNNPNIIDLLYYDENDGTAGYLHHATLYYKAVQLH
jgi:hypothetical protein